MHVPLADENSDGRCLCTEVELAEAWCWIRNGLSFPSGGARSGFEECQRMSCGCWPLNGTSSDSVLCIHIHPESSESSMTSLSAATGA